MGESVWGREVGGRGGGGEFGGGSLGGGGGGGGVWGAALGERAWVGGRVRWRGGCVSGCEGEVRWVLGWSGAGQVSVVLLR